MSTLTIDGWGTRRYAARRVDARRKAVAIPWDPYVAIARPRALSRTPGRTSWLVGLLAVGVLALHVGAFVAFGTHEAAPPAAPPKPPPVEVEWVRPPPPPPPPVQQVTLPKPATPVAKPSPLKPAVVRSHRQAPSSAPTPTSTPTPTPTSTPTPADTVVAAPPSPVAAAPGPAVVDAPPAPPAPPPEPVTQPRGSAGYLNNPAPTYPEIAQERGWQGRVVLKVHVTAAGKPSSIVVASSSSRKVLDDAAIKAVSAWTFMPAKRGTTPIDGWVQVPLDFKL